MLADETCIRKVVSYPRLAFGPTIAFVGRNVSKQSFSKFGNNPHLVVRVRQWVPY